MRALFVAVAIFVSACASEPAQPSQTTSVEPGLDALAADGRDIAEAQCASCHAVGPYGESPNPRAPVFRALFQRYEPDVLEEELIEGIRVAHPMPEFHFNPQGTDALIQYLRTIQEAPAEPRR